MGSWRPALGVNASTGVTSATAMGNLPGPIVAAVGKTATSHYSVTVFDYPGSMDAFLDTLIRQVAEHRAWVGALLALVTLLEALAVIGVLIPIMAVMLAAGALIAGGALHPVEVVLWCSAGAACGDAISYAIGQRIGVRAVRHPSLSKHRRHVARARLFTSRYGAAALVVGRYLGPLRPFVPMAAGMSRMRDRTFHAVNTLSAPVWVLTVLAPGYLAARNLGDWRPDPAILAGLAVVGIAAVIAVLALRRRPAAA
jgi:membrane protein DedA with SNARE-associated domain